MLKQPKRNHDNKVLTFVDMSHLSYLSKSVANTNALHKINHEHKPVLIPKDTKAAIEEDLSEEDYVSEDENQDFSLSPKKEKEITVQDIANEIFD